MAARRTGPAGTARRPEASAAAAARGHRCAAGSLWGIGRGAPHPRCPGEEEERGEGGMKARQGEVPTLPPRSPSSARAGSAPTPAPPSQTLPRPDPPSGGVGRRPDGPGLGCGVEREPALAAPSRPHPAVSRSTKTHPPRAAWATAAAARSPPWRGVPARPCRSQGPEGAGAGLSGAGGHGAGAELTRGPIPSAGRQAGSAAAGGGRGSAPPCPHAHPWRDGRSGRAHADRHARPGAPAWAPRRELVAGRGTRRPWTLWLQRRSEPYAGPPSPSATAGRAGGRRHGPGSDRAPPGPHPLPPLAWGNHGPGRAVRTSGGTSGPRKHDRAAV